MTRFANREELAAKIEWEGGFPDALDYGIKAADMPEGDTELAEAWSALEAAWNAVGPPLERVGDLLELDT
jgi:hypothetical protein